MSNAPVAGRKPDAILCPRDYPPVRGRQDRDVERNKLLGPVFGSKRVTSIARVDVPAPGESFVYPCRNFPPTDADRQTLYFDKGHPYEGQERYEWFIAVRQPDGSLVPGLPVEGHDGEDGRIKIGYLVEDPFRDDPEVIAAVRAEWEAKQAAHIASPEYRAEMKRRGIVLFSDPNREAVEAELRANPVGEPPQS